MSEHEPDDLLERARASYEPSEAARRRMKANIDAAIAAAAIGSVAASGTPSAAAATGNAALGTVAKVGVTLLCAAVIGTSVWLAQPSGRTAEPRATARTTESRALPAMPSAAEPSPEEPPEAPPLEEEIAVPDVAAVSPTVAAEGVLEPRPRRTARSPEPAPVDEAPPVVDALAIELGMLDEASAAIARGDYPAAQRALDAHARDFPAGAFRDERDVRRIVVLCATGRDDDARRSAAALEGRRLSPRARAELRASCIGE